MPRQRTQAQHDALCHAVVFALLVDRFPEHEGNLLAHLDDAFRRIRDSGRANEYWLRVGLGRLLYRSYTDLRIQDRLRLLAVAAQDITVEAASVLALAKEAPDRDALLKAILYPGGDLPSTAALARATGASVRTALADYGEPEKSFRLAHLIGAATRD